MLLIGPPSSGKSMLLDALTNAEVEVGTYPFTTQRVYPGMVSYEDIRIQLIETPPVMPDYMPAHLLRPARAVDAALLVADLATDSLLEDVEIVFAEFEKRHVRLAREKDLNDRDTVLARIIANKIDADGAQERCLLLRELICERLEIFPISCLDGTGVAALPAMLFEWLGIVRVYTKVPGEKAIRERPCTVSRGQTVRDAAALIHHDFYDNVQYARLWRGTGNPVMPPRHEEVKDGDIIEVHTS